MEAALSGLSWLFEKGSNALSVAVAVIVALLSKNALKYLGSKIGEGIGGDIVKRLEPQIKKTVTEIVDPIKIEMFEIKKNQSEMKTRLDSNDSDRRAKHDAKGNYSFLLEAIKNKDQELIDIHLDAIKKPVKS